MQKIDHILQKITTVLFPIIGPCRFEDNLTLSYSIDRTAIWLAIKEKRGRVIVDIASPIVINPKMTEGILETLNSYNLEETITLVFMQGNKSNSVIARCEIDSEFFSEEEFKLKIDQITNYSLNLSKNLTILWAGKTFADYHGK